MYVGILKVIYFIRFYFPFENFPSSIRNANNIKKKTYNHEKEEFIDWQGTKN